MRPNELTNKETPIQTITKPINRFLPVPLTTPEKVDYGRNLAHLHQEYAALEIEKKHVADTFKDRLEGLDGRISALAVVVRNGEEVRDVECHWRYLFESNTKELIRMDTGEIVETTAISASERQLVLQIEQEKEAETIASETIPN